MAAKKEEDWEVNLFINLFVYFLFYLFINLFVILIFNWFVNLFRMVGKNEYLVGVILKRVERRRKKLKQKKECEVIYIN